MREETGIEATVEKLLGVYSNPRHVSVYDDGEVRQQSRSAFCAALSAASLEPGLLALPRGAGASSPGAPNVARATLESGTRFGKLHKSAERVRKLTNP